MIQERLEQEVVHLNELIDSATARVRAKVTRKAFESCAGWNDPAKREWLIEAVQRNASECDWLDVIGLAVFLWEMDGRPPGQR